MSDPYPFLLGAAASVSMLWLIRQRSEYSERKYREKSMNLEMAGFCYLCSFETDRRSSQYLLGEIGDPLPQRKVRVPLMAHWIKVTALPGGSLKIQDFATGVTLVFNSDGILLDEDGNPKDDPYYWLES